jgi:uncharacterized membrane protein
MIGRLPLVAPLLPALALAACHGGAASPSAAPSPTSTVVTAADTQAYSGIGPDEMVRFTGTEPFWGGQVSGEALTYTTPENQTGEMIAVDRFAGRNGISFSGELGGMPFVLALTPGRCSDGMSDRRYPFTVTLQVKGEQRKGCAWSDKHPLADAAKP